MNPNRQSQLNFVDSRPTGERRLSVWAYFEILAFYGVLFTVALASIPNGAVSSWQKQSIVVLICIFAGFRVIENMFRGPYRIAGPGLLFPLFGVVCLALAQAVRWPGTASPLSFDPNETKSFVLVFGGLLFAGEVLFRYAGDPVRRRHLIGLVILVGVASAIFGLLRPVYLDSIFVSLAADSQATQGYAQFVNRNHFALLMEMTLGLLLGFLINGKLSAKLKLSGWILSGIVVIALITANSRGGLMSLAALCVFAALIHFLTRDRQVGVRRDRSIPVPERRGAPLRRTLAVFGICAVVLASVVVMIVFVGGDQVVTRIEKVRSEVESAEGRVNRAVIWTSTVELIKKYPVTGVGFGGYPTAITGFDPSTGEFSLEQAHNEYLEILANGGIVGFALFAVFGMYVTLRISRNLRSDDRLTRSASFGAAIGIFGVLVHSLVDFGLHTMVNGLIFAALIVLATVDDPARPSERPRGFGRPADRTA